MKIPEIFERKTVKNINAIFDVDEYKQLVHTYIEYGEWFTVAGLRRTGKTTLVRSIVAFMGSPSIYINLWELSPYGLSIKTLINRLIEEINHVFSGKMCSVGRRIKEISLFGFKISFSSERPSEALTKLIERIIKNKKRLIIVLDEIQELGQDLGKLIKYLGAIHDLFAPKLVVILLGSVISLKNILKKVKGAPLRGRITREIILKPFDMETAIGFLKEGFNQCGITIQENTLIRIVEFLGGFPGWLSEYGRLYIETYTKTKKKPDPLTILNTVFNDAREAIYEEIAKLVYQRKKLLNYIKILKHIAINITTPPTEIAKMLKTTRVTAYKYLKYLHQRAILETKNGKYYIIDPLIRRAMTQPDAEDKILQYLKNI